MEIKKYKINVNDKDFEVDAPEEMPLLWILRDKLDLKGTKFGCGKGLCGSCTVHLDDESVRSCQTVLSECEGKKITTIEKVGTEPDSPLVKAWQDLNIPQCGYCQSGQIMSASALIKANKKPTELDIDAHMSGNICRCGTYQRIKKGILGASGQLDLWHEK